MKILTSLPPESHHSWLLLVWLLFLLSPSVGAAAEKGKRLEAEGKVFYKVKWTVKNEYRGTIETLMVGLNGPVKKGQVLATYTLDTYVWNKLKEDLSTAQINRLALEVEEIRSDMKIKQRDLDAALILLKEGMASPISVDAKKAALSLLSDKLRYAREELQLSKRQLKLRRERIAENMGGVKFSGALPRTAQLVSPIDGNVIQIPDDQNQDLEERTTCFVIADTRDIFVNARVYLDDYPQLREGMKASLLSPTATKIYPAVVTSLPLTPVDRRYASLSYYNVELDIDDPDCPYREGNSVTVTFLLDSVTETKQ